MKKPILVLLSVLAIATTIAFMSFAGKDSVSLRLCLEKGKTYSFKTKANQVMTMNVQGQSMNTTQNIEITNTIHVIDVVNEQFITELTTNNFKFSQTTMGTTFTYDSEHPEDSHPILQIQTSQLKEMMEQAYNLSLDVMGNITNRDSTIFNQDMVSFFTTFPEEAVHVGSTWSHDASTDISGISSSNHITYTVTKITKKEVHADFTSSLSASGKAELKGTGSGTVVFDIATGMAKTSTTKNNISMTINEQGMSIPATINGTTTITLE